MKDQKLLTKIFAFAALLSGIIWIGSYAIRLMVSYRLFDFEMNLLFFLNKEKLEAIFFAITPLINTTFAVYIIFIISFTVFILSTNLKLKTNGWLFIITLIIYITLPFEIYLMTIDYKLIYELNCTEIINTDVSTGLIRDRYTQLSGFPLILLLSYCSIVYFLIFKPFSSDKANEN